MEIGAALPLDDSARVLLSVVDKDTMGRLEDGKTPLESCEKQVDWIRSREVRLRSRSKRGTSSKDPNAMVYSVGEDLARYETHTPDYEGPHYTCIVPDNCSSNKTRTKHVASHPTAVKISNCKPSRKNT